MNPNVDRYEQSIKWLVEAWGIFSDGAIYSMTPDEFKQEFGKGATNE